MDEFSGTKELIFDAFIEMTSELGYESVSIRDIARKVGINSASIYYHFENKGKILECAYNYYAQHQYDARRPIEMMRAVIETADAEEFVRTLFYTFDTDDPKKHARMARITKIIYMRLFQDPIANAMFAESNNHNAEYAIGILRYGVGVGRIDSSFDLESFVNLLMGSMDFIVVKSLANPAYASGQLEQEKRNLALLSRLLSAALK
ncbi:MAG: TetR/AcrR family transcriptional regulator [Dehalococcoidia bacterium]|nr:TetR/AcrR family transcriptional regulator [Dehalococcoidia bacterium]